MMTLEEKKEYNKKRYKKYITQLKIYRENNKEKHKEYAKIHYEQNKVKIKQKYNKELKKEYNKNYNKKNRDKINNNRKLRIKNDILFKLKSSLRRRIIEIFKVKFLKKNNTTKYILGCEFETAKNHLENKFIDGMNWENHGEWHIDHIIPLASAKTEDELLKLCHYTNLQPLWALDNLIKGDKIL